MDLLDFSYPNDDYLFLKVETLNLLILLKRKYLRQTDSVIFYTVMKFT